MFTVPTAERWHNTNLSKYERCSRESRRRDRRLDAIRVNFCLFFLPLTDPPIVKLSLGHTFDPSRIKTGDDVYFECKVLDGGGKGKQHNRIEWYHNVSVRRLVESFENFVIIVKTVLW